MRRDARAGRSPRGPRSAQALLVESLGGIVVAENAPSGGAVFTVDLPLDGRAQATQDK